MKRCTRTLLMALALLLAPCAAFAVPETAASPAPSVELAPAVAMTEAGYAAPSGGAGMPAPDLSAGDIDGSFSPADAQRLTLEERLSLQEAVCALWHSSMMQDPAPVESLDPMALEAPDHIFLQGFHYRDDGWVFEGIVRLMTPDSTGIEVISHIQGYRVHFQRTEDGGFKIVSASFSEVGMG